MTRGYEALIIVKAAGTEQEVAQATGQLEELVRKMGGTIETAQNLGRRRLAFRINRQTEGYYFVVRFAAPTQAVLELERNLRLNEAVIRFIVLTGDEAASTVLTVNRPRPAGHRESAVGAER